MKLYQARTVPKDGHLVWAHEFEIASDTMAVEFIQRHYQIDPALRLGTMGIQVWEVDSFGYGLRLVATISQKRIMSETVVEYG